MLQEHGNLRNLDDLKGKGEFEDGVALVHEALGLFRSQVGFFFFFFYCLLPFPFPFPFPPLSLPSPFSHPLPPLSAPTYSKKP